MKDRNRATKENFVISNPSVFIRVPTLVGGAVVDPLLIAMSPNYNPKTDHSEGLWTRP